ncbi:MAG: NADH-quinone oxidoreductase subunit J [Phycisphaerae bacterium]
MIAYLIYGVFALGAAGIYFLMPRGGDSKSRIGMFFGLGGLALLIGVLVANVAPQAGDAFLYLFGAIALVAAVRVITHPVPIYSALYFILVVVAVAALLVLLAAEFTAIALVTVYAGAILVTYLFVIMLSQQDEAPAYDTRAREPFMAVLTSFFLMAVIAGHAGDLVPPRNEGAVKVQYSDASDDEAQVTPAAYGEVGETESKRPGNTRAIGFAILTQYVVALELAGILLLVSMVGAIAVSRKRVSFEGPMPEQQPIGQAGKEVKPF